MLVLYGCTAETDVQISSTTTPTTTPQPTTARIILTKTPLVSGTLIPTNLPPTDTLVGTVLESKVSEIAFVSPYKGNYAIYTVMTDGTKLTILTQDMVFIFSPHWSPKGDRLIFSGCLVGNVDCSGNFNIFSVNADGSHLVNLTNNSANNKDPGWSPDGKQIVFDSNRSGNYEIFVMNSDGTGIIQLTHDSTDDTNPQWSPNGSWIAYMSGSSTYNIYIMSPDGTKMMRFGEGLEPNWSPDSKWIAFHDSLDGHIKIYLIRPDGTNLKILDNSPADEFDYSWSPDSQLIAFTTNRDYNAEIYTSCVDCENHQQTNITNDTAIVMHPSWSPDGTQIAFLSDDSVCVMSVSSSQKKCLNFKALGTIIWKP